MELDVFPEELRKQAVGIGQVLKMDMYPSDRGGESLRGIVGAGDALMMFRGSRWGAFFVWGRSMGGRFGW